MRIETQRLIITRFTPDMAEAVHLGSMDEDTQRFLLDEVFPTTEIAAEVICDLIDCYDGTEGPYVYPFLLRDGTYAGYVQLVAIAGGWEVGYHTVKSHTCSGYATEALTAFLPAIMARLGLRQVLGVCDAANVASIRVLEKCGFRQLFAGNDLYQGEVRPVVKLIYQSR